MVKHIILWNLKEEYDEETKAQIKQGIKEGLEGLKGQIPGLVDIKVYTEPLASSNCDVMLESVFEDQESLVRYSGHPLHVAVATGKVRPYIASRICMDTETL
ncbi:MAG: Dabb family protein [Lachnospiraceae bacterium]|nr:Dabb family protein [Lachnospiraceae bacterium]